MCGIFSSSDEVFYDARSHLGDTMAETPPSQSWAPIITPSAGVKLEFASAQSGSTLPRTTPLSLDTDMFDKVPSWMHGMMVCAWVGLFFVSLPLNTPES
jgi:hypothetical protein